MLSWCVRQYIQRRNPVERCREFLPVSLSIDHILSVLLHSVFLFSFYIHMDLKINKKYWVYSGFGFVRFWFSLDWFSHVTGFFQGLVLWGSDLVWMGLAMLLGLFRYENKVLTVMINNSTNINKKNNYWTQKKSWHMKLEIQVLPWDRHKNVVELNQLLESQTSPLDN